MEVNDADLARERELLTGKLVEVQQQVALLAASVPKDSRRHQHLQRQLASTKQKLEALAAVAPPGPHSLGGWIPTSDNRSGEGSTDDASTKDVLGSSYPAQVSTPSALPRASSRNSPAPPAPPRDTTSQWVPSTPLAHTRTPSHSSEAPPPATPARTPHPTSQQGLLGQLQHSLAQAVRDNQLLWDACGASGAAVPASPRLGHRTGWTPPTRSNLTISQKAEVLEMVQRQEQLRKSSLQVPAPLIPKD